MTDDVIIDHRLQSANWVPSPNFDARPDESDISLIVMHCISLPPAEYGNGYVEQFFQNQLDCTLDPYFERLVNLKVSSHLFIDREGGVTQFVDFNQRAWHAGVSEYKGKPDCNDYSIGIELEGTDDSSFEDAQYESLLGVLKMLIHKYPQLSSRAIVGHSTVAPGRKTDPGSEFEWSKVMRDLRSERL